MPWPTTLRLVHLERRRRRRPRRAARRRRVSRATNSAPSSSPPNTSLTGRDEVPDAVDEQRVVLGHDRRAGLPLQHRLELGPGVGGVEPVDHVVDLAVELAHAVAQVVVDVGLEVAEAVVERARPLDWSPPSALAALPWPPAAPRRSSAGSAAANAVRSASNVAAQLVDDVLDLGGHDVERSAGGRPGHRPGRATAAAAGSPESSARVSSPPASASSRSGADTGNVRQRRCRPRSRCPASSSTMRRQCVVHVDLRRDVGDRRADPQHRAQELELVGRQLLGGVGHEQHGVGHREGGGGDRAVDRARPPTPGVSTKARPASRIGCGSVTSTRRTWRGGVPEPWVAGLAALGHPLGEVVQRQRQPGRRRPRRRRRRRPPRARAVADHERHRRGDVGVDRADPLARGGR